MTRAEQKTLILLARQPRGLFPDPSLPEWCALLDDLLRKGLAYTDRTTANCAVYRITTAGIASLSTEAMALDRRAYDALGIAHVCETSVAGIVDLNTAATLTELRRRLLEADEYLAHERELREAAEAVTWGEFGPCQKIVEPRE